MAGENTGHHFKAKKIKNEFVDAEGLRFGREYAPLSVV